MCQLQDLPRVRQKLMLPQAVYLNPRRSRAFARVYARLAAFARQSRKNSTGQVHVSSTVRSRIAMGPLLEPILIPCGI
ncbi:hypothetical protein BV22DRAFT_1031537 [Leucogyrophana mollusca]|uniref:Uncharacterized protein n=1 Tax=Leucogyrophana mollusca TaxID=85980 RepID=A0ACB8BQ52_9AGAM|nr:hypothetical protein BV22DRAFT_1031537 [Leucogyrophana mollusca]